MKSAKYAGYVAISERRELKEGSFMEHANITDIPTYGKFYVVIRTCSELKERHFMVHTNITDIPTYLRLCGRPHNLRYSLMLDGTGTELSLGFLETLFECASLLYEVGFW